jgi:hypothetical protein
MNMVIRHGTLIAAFLTKSDIFLASDGRVIHKDSGEICNDWSKVHQINKHVGMLTAGAYLPYLKDDVVRNCIERDISSVDEVAKITCLVLKEIWRLNVAKFEREGNLNEVRIFVFLAGFDSYRCPRLLYLDNMSDPMFSIQERLLFQTGSDLEIAAMSTGSGQEEDPATLVSAEINKNLGSRSGNTNLLQVLNSAFNKTKNRLSATNPRIGGKTFFSRINLSSGYQDITTEISV